MQIYWKKECAVAMTAILCCSMLPEWIPFSAAAAVSYPVQEIRIGVGDTDRNLFAENTTVSAQTQMGSQNEKWSITYDGAEWQLYIGSRCRPDGTALEHCRCTE